MGLRVEVDELHSAGARMSQSVSAPVTLGSSPVGAAAGDQVSATVAAGLSLRLQAIGAHSLRAAHIASTAAGVLHANAATYREQEESNAASLRSGGATAGAVAASSAWLTAAVRPTPAPPLPASPPAGVVPSDGKSIAVVMHGGTGPGPLLAAAGAARAHALELQQISTSLRAAGDRLAVDWQSAAAEAATARIATLASWYDSHAEHAAATARVCENQADSFARARAAIPRPEEFADLERRLEAANRANVAARGAYTPVITQLQTQLATTHAQAVSAYADYSTRAADVGADSPTPAPPTVQALDTPIQESPADDASDDGSWQNQPSPRTFQEVQDALRQLRRGENKPHRELDTPEEIRQFWDWVTGNSAGPAPSSAPFPRELLDDGTTISFRPDSDSGGETVTVTGPGGKDIKVHLPLTPPIISGPPQLPPLADHPPFAPPLPGPVNPAPAVLPPWLQSPALHGTPIPSQGPTIMPGVPLPASPPVTSIPAPGPALLPQIGDDLAEAGQVVVGGVAIGVAIILGVLGIGPGAATA